MKSFLHGRVPAPRHPSQHGHVSLNVIDYLEVVLFVSTTVVLRIAQEIARHEDTLLAKAYVLDLDPESFIVRRQQRQIFANDAEIVSILSLLQLIPRVCNLRSRKRFRVEERRRLPELLAIHAEEDVMFNRLRLNAGTAHENDEQQNLQKVIHIK